MAALMELFSLVFTKGDLPELDDSHLLTFDLLGLSEKEIKFKIQGSKLST